MSSLLETAVGATSTESAVLKNKTLEILGEPDLQSDGTVRHPEGFTQLFKQFADNPGLQAVAGQDGDRVGVRPA